MAHTHFVYIHAPSDDRPYNFEVDEDFIFEAEDKPNPFDSDDPDVAYHEYLAERFSQR